MRFTLLISILTLVLCGNDDMTETGYIIYPVKAYKQLGKSVSHWTQDLPNPMRKEMIRVVSTDMSASDYWILQDEFVTQKEAERQCKLMTLRLAIFKNIETAASVIKLFREHNCPDCGRFTAWIRKMRGRCTRKDNCTFISLNNGTLGDGDYCNRSRRQQKNVTMPYICEDLLREANPFESKRQNATAMYDTNSRYDAKRMITRIHILHPSDESGQGRILSWAGAKQECARFGYELSSLSQKDVDKIGNNLDPKGLYWVARRKEDIKKGLCTVLSAFTTNKLAAIDCKGEFKKESDRILGYICVSHHRKLKPPVPKGKSKFKILHLKDDPTSKRSPLIKKNPNIKKGPSVGSRPSSKKTALVNNNPSAKKSPSMNKNPSLKAAPSVNNKPISKKSLSVNNNPSTKKSPSLSRNPNLKKDSSDNKSITKKCRSLINNPSHRKRILGNNNRESKTTKKARQWLLPVFDKFKPLQPETPLELLY